MCSSMLANYFEWMQALLCNYFEAGGSRAQLVVPKQLDLQQLICQGPTQPLPYDLSHNDGFGDFDDD